jgi:hypothetical protein
MRKISIDVAGLLMAFEDNSYEMDWRLDLESGQTVAITEDTRLLLNEYFDESGGEDGRAAFERWLAGCDCPDWQKDAVREAYEIETQEARFLSIPSDESRDAYNDMVHFAHTVEDERLQELLSVALNGRGAFRRFKDVLSGASGEEEKQWYAFRDARVKQRLLEWLESEGIEMIERIGPEAC